MVHKSYLSLTSLKIALIGGIACALVPYYEGAYASSKSNGAPAEAMKSFAPIVEPLLPSVVNISTITEAAVEQRRPEQGFPGSGTPLEEFFRHFMEEYHGRPRKSSSLGSGFIVSQKDSTAFVVTCYHLIADADEIKLTLHNGQEYKAQIVGKDRRTDLAVLKFTASEKLTTTKWGDSSKARVGDWVIAIGNPFGLSSTVTTGIISTIARDIGTRARGLLTSIVEGFIQTDASINLGNSGGPMFNAQGEVIGINTAIYSPNGGSIGIGFAVPSSLAEAVTQKLITDGHAFSGWIGVKVQQVSAEMAESIGLKEPRGALVGEITPKSPAAKALLMAGDVILKFNGVPIKNSDMLPRIVAKTAVNQTVPIVIFREGKELTLQITVGDFEKAEKEGIINIEDDKPSKLFKTQRKVLGLALQNLTSSMKERFNLPESSHGGVIVALEPDCEAAEKGLRPGDVIQEVTAAGKKTPIRTPEDFEMVITDARKAGHRQVLLLILRGGATHFVTLGLKEAEQDQPKDQGPAGETKPVPLPLPGR